MSDFEEWTIAFAAIAVLVSIWAIVVSKQSMTKADAAGAKAEEAADKANRISEGTIELYLSEVISKARDRQSQIILATIEGVPADIKAKQIVGLLEDAREEYLNAIEEGCAKYLDSKIDKDRFKESYRYQIKNVMEDPLSRKIIDLRVNRFRSIETVYFELFPEKRRKG